MFKNFNAISKKIHDANVEKGFYDEPKKTAELLMLIVSELAEALEADRKSKKAYSDSYKKITNGYFDPDAFVSCIKDSFEDEIADTFIRLFDLCGHYNIDIAFHIEEKLRFNQSRPHKHGKEY